ncbi:hypothetical protein L3Y34_019752 [Caenorhabditis briggsae]|uniref:Uncharacterized protein n=1 Tax=Caenorhabditis briggsae TaxID=6238 RepID=A0AAE9DPK7_CAEBR|nr:hypothetical protein L3Y34_019752 [Caenorhabditis briggsae]
MLIIWQFAVLLFIINPTKCESTVTTEESSTVTSTTMEKTPQTSTVLPETSTVPTTVLPITITTTIRIIKTTKKAPIEDVTSSKPEDVECGGEHICFDDQPIGESDGKNYWNFIFAHFLGFLVFNWAG